MTILIATTAALGAAAMADCVLVLWQRYEREKED